MQNGNVAENCDLESKSDMKNSEIQSQGYYNNQFCFPLQLDQNALRRNAII